MPRDPVGRRARGQQTTLSHSQSQRTSSSLAHIAAHLSSLVAKAFLPHFTIFIAIQNETQEVQFLIFMPNILKYRYLFINQTPLNGEK
jgi:hypothetical protein